MCGGTYAGIYLERDCIAIYVKPLDKLKIKDQNATSLCTNTTGKWPDIGSEITCAEGFYLDNNSHPICIPLCDTGSWVGVSRTLAGDIIFVVSIITTIVSFIILIVVLWPQRDTMYDHESHNHTVRI